MDDDLEDALTWQADEDDRCSGCGQLRSESMDPDQMWRWDTKILRCFACEAKEKAAKRFSGDGGDTTGIYLGVGDH